MERLLSKPHDFTWDELTAFMDKLGYALKSGAGSSRKFIHGESKAVFMCHQPHPTRILKAYQIKNLIAFLQAEQQL